MVTREGWLMERREPIFRLHKSYVIRGFIRGFLKSLFILRERERESTHKQRRGRERGRQRIPSRLLAVSAELDRDLDLRNREILT